ncbi:MAG: ABC transporter permease [Clostridiales bacterium]|nr:ABC transporter permease [Clostridiales bacterium]
MVSHIFKYRLKCLIGSRTEIFWTLIYPIVLAVFFSLAFSNLTNVGNFSPVEIAVVDNNAFRNEPYFAQALGQVSDKSDDGRLFNVTLTTQEDADARLNKNQIKGYIVFDDGPRVVVRSTGIEQTILTEFMNSYVQTGSAYAAVARGTGGQGALLRPEEKSYFTETNAYKSGADSIVVSFYALISMAAMFGGFRGKVEVENMQANLSPQGARMNLVPVNKLKIFSWSLLATILIQFVSMVLLVAFMALVLNINFGSQLIPVLVTCFFASTAGVTFGAMLASVIRAAEGVRMGLLIGISLLLSSLAGMVYPDLKYVVTQAVPALSYINPANLISDAFYSLYYYGAGPRFYLNSGLLLAFSVLFTLVVYLATRRQKYASL